MEPLEERLEQLGRTIAKHSDENESTDRVIHGARRRMQLSLRNRRATPGLTQRPGIRFAIAAVAAVLLSLGAYELWPEPPRPLTVQLESDSAALIGRWIGSRDETKQLRFSDGTSLSLHPQTDLKVERTSTTGASVIVGRGRTLASVNHSDGADWRFAAGPFSIEVTGTEFDLAWHPEKGVFEIALHQGAVKLTGPTLAGARSVRKGEFVRIELPAEQQTPTMGKHQQGAPVQESEVDPRSPGSGQRSGWSAPATSSGQSNDEPSDSRVAHEKLSNDEQAVQETKNGGPSATNWRQLLASGQRTKALQAVRQMGAATAIQSAPAKSLWKLSQAARLGGEPRLAQQVLLALRSQHGVRGRSAFMLGKVAADQLHDTSGAVQWFETYLREAPGGALSEQALGRLVELQAGTRQGRRAAERYLEAYPDGAHASFARSSLR